MKNVLIKSKVFFRCVILLLLLFLFCNNKPCEIITHSSKENKKSNLSFDVDFSKIGYGRIIKHIDTTGLNDENQLINIHLIFPSEFKKKYTITKKKVARTMPFEFRLQEEDNGNISFLITQFYHPYDDSLVFIKTKNGLQFKEFYNNAYSSSNYRNYIKKGEFKQKGNHIELYNNINYP